MKQTPLHAIHKELGARMVEFGGWDMPVQYSGIREEHRAVRTKAGLFDISHMGEIFVEGSGARAAVQRLTCNDINNLQSEQCQYSALLTEQGTFVDDIIVYPLQSDKILICVNAGNTDKDFKWIQENCPDDVTVRNESADWCQLAVQGPDALGIATEVFGNEIKTIRRFYFKFIPFLDQSILISRTGYTGEDGFEVYGPSELAAELWQRLMLAGHETGLIPCGLGARDTLRLEVNYPLYGHEIDDQHTPFETGLSWIVKLEGEDFIGKSTLLGLQHKVSEKQLVAFKMEESGIPREGYTILHGNEAVGGVVSGTFSPTLEVGIGTGFVTHDAAKIGTKIAIDIRGRKRIAAIVPRPFYKK